MAVVNLPSEAIGQERCDMSGELFKDESGFRAQQDKDSFLDYSLDWSDWLAGGVRLCPACGLVPQESQ